MNTASEVWSKVKDILSSELTSTAIATWFDDCTAVELRENELVLYSPNDFKKDIIESRLSGNIKNALKELLAADMDVTILGKDQLESFRSREEETGSGPCDEYTFERFVVGSSNKFAHAAALNMANDDNNTFNPLFIYGDSGLGKTHLLHAIRHTVLQRHPDYHVVLVNGEDFTNELITAIQLGKTQDFRDKYRQADMFLMDDIQFIAGKTSTQEEYFHTFNALFAANRKIAFTSDRPPEEIKRLDDRLKTRFMSGVIADIQPPDYETRMAIIRNRAQQLHLSLSDEVSDYIAQNLTSNVRQIEGAVKKTMAYCEIMNIPSSQLTTADIARIIKDFFKEKSEYTPTPEDIIRETAKYYSISPEDIKGERRSRTVAQARHVSIYLIRTLTTFSLNDIGEFFGGRDHTTVLASIRKVEGDIKRSPDLAQTIKDITANINSRN